MAYRRGLHRDGGGGRGAPMGFLSQPPGSPSAPRPAPQVPNNPDATGPQQRAYQHGVVPVPHGPSPATIRAASPKVRALSPTAARVSAPAPTPAAPSPTPSPATIAKELEKLFVTEVAAVASSSQVGEPALTPSPTLYTYEPSPGTIPTPPSSPASIRALSPTAARVSAPAPTPAAPSRPTINKDLEHKPLVTDMAMAPPAAAATSDPAVSNKLLVHRARPGPWTIRKKLMIRVNQFIPNAAHKNLFYYDVSIKPEPKSKAGDKQVLSELINLHGKTTFRDKLPVYDGKSLYTAGQLPFDSEEKFSVTLVDPEKKDNERAEREYKITIRIAGTTDLYHLQQVLRPRQSYVTVPRSFFSITFSHRGNIGEGLECWGGYHQILRPTQMGHSLVIDIPATSFLKHATGVQSVPGFLNLRDTSRPLTYMDQIKKKLPGVRVETGFTPIPMSQLIFLVDERNNNGCCSVLHAKNFWKRFSCISGYGDGQDC